MVLIWGQEGVSDLRLGGISGGFKVESQRSMVLSVNIRLAKGIEYIYIKIYF